MAFAIKAGKVKGPSAGSLRPQMVLGSRSPYMRSPRIQPVGAGGNSRDYGKGSGNFGPPRVNPAGTSFGDTGDTPLS